MGELERTIRDQFTDLFDENKSIETIYKRVRNGTATYTEAHKFALEIGKILTKTFKDNLTDVNIDAEAEYIVEQMLHQNVRLVSGVCEFVQQNLNDAAEVGIKPIAPSTARNADRVGGIMSNFKETQSTVKLAQQGETLTLALVDEWVKTNADFQAKAGLSPVIVRVWDGTWGSHDTKHTDYCSKIQGTFSYRPTVGYGMGTSGWDGPKDLFKRHEGCQCIITYYPNKTAQGRITALAKGQKDSKQELWNTGQEFSNSRNAELRRRRQKYGKEEARKILNEEWRGGFNGNAERHF